MQANSKHAKNLKMMTICAIRALPKLRRTIGVSLVYCLVRQRVRGLSEFVVDMSDIPRDVMLGQGLGNAYALSMKGTEDLRSACPRMATCKLPGQKQRTRFKEYVGVPQPKRTRQTFQQANVLGFIVAGVAPKRTARGGKSRACAKTTLISRLHGSAPTRVSFCICALASASPVRPVDSIPRGWRRRCNPVSASPSWNVSGNSAPAKGIASSSTPGPSSPRRNGSAPHACTST